MPNDPDPKPADKAEWIERVLKVKVGGRPTAGPAPDGAALTASPADGAFAPDLETSAPKLVIDVNETLILKLKIRNWNQAPKGIKLTWGAGTSSRDVFKIELEHHDGEGSIKVTGLAPGKGEVNAEVKVGEGRTYHFTTLNFAVPVPVPDLDTPYVPRQVLGVGQSVPLKFKIRNWGPFAKATNISWSLNPDGDAVKLSEEKFNGGEATVTVTATHKGKATIQAAVRVLSNDAAVDYFFDKTGFLVKEVSELVDIDQGDIADAKGLERDMYGFLSEWEAAANNGVNEFVAGALNQRINDLATGSVTVFLETLFGAAVWAAACFETGGAAFAISVAGITFGAIASGPSKDDQQFIPDIQNAMFGQINAIFAHNKGELGSKAKALLERNPSIMRYHALALFVQASFQSKYISVDDTFTRLPILNQDAITATYLALAQEELDKAIEAEKKREAEEKRKPSRWKGGIGPGPL